MTNAPRDNNQIPTLLAVNSADGATPIAVEAVPSSHELSVSDGTALSPLVIDSYGEGNQSATWSMYASSSAKYLAQSFAVADECILHSCKFYASKTGSPTGNMTAFVYAHTGTFGGSGKPGTGLATSDTEAVSGLTTSLALKTFNFSGSERITLAANTKYFVGISYLSGNVSNRLNVGYDNTSPSHQGNTATGTNGSVWNVQANDVCFYLYAYKTAAGNARRDENSVPLAMAVSSDDGASLVEIYAASTGELLVKST